MKLNLNTSAVPTRENRLGSITGYAGGLHELLDSSGCGTLKNRERCFSQSSTCLSGCAVGLLSSIRDVAVVWHAPAGCHSFTNVLGDQLARNINASFDTKVVGTDLSESDTVFGALDSARSLAYKAYGQYHPKAIFIASSCVTGVIGEDIDSIVEELSEELGVPVASVHCEGFKSRIWASGFDLADHAVLRHLVKPPKEKRRVVNFKNFFESERSQITELFARLDVTPQFLYSNSTVEELSHLSESLATVCICGTLGTYLGNGLEELYGVPYVRTVNPMGMTGFETWFREIGRLADREAQAEQVIREQREKYLPDILKIKEEIKGHTAVIGMGPGYTYEVMRVCQELGIEVVHAAAWHLDHKYDDGRIPPALDYLRRTSPVDVALSVADQQNFEIVNILNRYRPDLYFSRHPGSTVWAIKQGVTAVFVADEYMIFGYRGTLNFAKTVRDNLVNRSFEKNLAARVQLPYTDWWYRQDSDSLFVKSGGEQ
ncbi:MAG: nitrogenase [Clostridium sp.]|nr:nitrogenase [Clostridium sp.]